MKLTYVQLAMLGDKTASKKITEQGELLPCPCCGENAVSIGVYDDEGNYRGEIGCEYESNPWSGKAYGLRHKGWAGCILCTDTGFLGGALFDTVEEALIVWNNRAPALSENQLEEIKKCQPTLMNATRNSSLKKDIFEKLIHKEPKRNEE